MDQTTTLTHGGLVKRAAKWLANSRGCAVVVTEIQVGREMPDAFGWAGGRSILVECKVSVADIRADKYKPGRRTLPEYKAGTWRYIMVPEYLREAALKGAAPNWGVLCVYPRRVVIACESAVFEARPLSEIDALISCLRRIAGRREPVSGVNVRFYTQDRAPTDREPRASLTVLPEEAAQE